MVRVLGGLQRRHPIENGVSGQRDHSDVRHTSQRLLRLQSAALPWLVLPSARINNENHGLATLLIALVGLQQINSRLEHL